MENELTVVVNSCDTYSDVWDLFFTAFQTQWKDCPYNIVLNTQNMKYSFKNLPITVHNHHMRKGQKDQWGKRYRETLETISTTYVLPILDDFVFTEPVKNPELIEEIVKFMDENSNVTVVYLDAFPKWCFTLEESKELPKFGKMPQVCSYKLSTGTAVWRRERLISLIKDFETPWEWEMYASYRACRLQCGDFYAPVDALEDLPKNMMFKFPLGGVIRRGLWHSDAKELIDRYGIDIDVNIRGIMDKDNPYREEHIEEYSVRANFKHDFYKRVFWKNVILHAKIKYKTLYEEYRLFRSFFSH